MSSFPRNICFRSRKWTSLGAMSGEYGVREAESRGKGSNEVISEMTNLSQSQTVDKRDQKVVKPDTCTKIHRKKISLES